MNPEIIIRLGVFAGLLLLLLGWEQLAPRRSADGPRGYARLHNLLLVGVDTLCVRLLVPLAAAGTAEVMAARGWGLFNQMQRTVVAGRRRQLSGAGSADLRAAYCFS
ncbi:MAG: hypothetical protein U5P41_11575 [Gammaproteobacteria bacterium]|nr:hypothetical protein [Gammaproteobacteria bacterium]